MSSMLQLLVMLAFLSFPLIEIAVLVAVGGLIGFWPTFGLLILSAGIGVAVVRHQGLAMLPRMLDAIGRGGPALGAVMDSYAKIAAGCLLIFPGFISDAIGLALLVPALRRGLLWSLYVSLGGRRPERPGDGAQRDAADASQPRHIVIDATYERLDEKDPPRS